MGKKRTGPSLSALERAIAPRRGGDIADLIKMIEASASSMS